MSKSSINIQKVSAHSFLHNDRTESKIAKTVKPEHTHKNKYSVSAKNAKKKYDNLYSQYSEKATELKTRARVKKENSLFEAVVNIKNETTIEELEKLAAHIEKKFGFTGLQISMHKDEGYYDKNNNDEWTPNLHAHLSFFTINQESNKQMMRRELVTREHLRDLQTETAEILNMERGVDKRISKTERLDHKAYAQSKKIVEDQILKVTKIKQSEIDKIKKDLDKQIKESELDNTEKKELYKQVRELQKDLKAQNKAKELSTDLMNSKVLELENQIKSMPSAATIKALQEESYQNEYLKDENTALESKISTLESKIRVNESNSSDKVEKAVYEEMVDNANNVVKKHNLLSNNLKMIKNDLDIDTNIQTIDISKDKKSSKFTEYVKKTFNDLKQKVKDLLSENKLLKNENKELKNEIVELKSQKNEIVEEKKSLLEVAKDSENMKNENKELKKDLELFEELKQEIRQNQKRNQERSRSR